VPCGFTPLQAVRKLDNARVAHDGERGLGSLISAATHHARIATMLPSAMSFPPRAQYDHARAAEITN
jgi:hypothetical protein